MNLTKFLLMDIGLILIGLILLFFFKTREGNTSFFKNSFFLELLEQPKFDIPDYKNLLELEKIARREGTGIEIESLQGEWKFFSVWDQGPNQKTYIFSALLRLFSASLEIQKKK